MATPTDVSIARLNGNWVLVNNDDYDFRGLSL
jgi:hypothetical protein